MAIVNLKNVRLAFPDIFTPGKFDENSEPKYGATLLVPAKSAQIAEINKAILEAATAKWGAKAAALVKSFENNPNKYCFQNGDTKTNYDGFEGNWALSAKNSTRPFVCDRDKSPLTAEDGKPYAGCYVNAQVDIYVQDNKWGKGVRASLKGIQFFKDGDAFAAGAPANADDFDDLSVTEDDELA